MMSYDTETLIALDREYVWHPFTPMKAWVEKADPLVIARGEGIYLYDTTGRRYIDGSASIWCNVHGHAVPVIDAAITAQLQQVAHTSLLGLANIPSTLLAKRLIDLAPAGLRKVFYSDNGSTAVEVACKMAYQFWQNQGQRQRTRFLAFDWAYHGDTLGAVSLGGIPLFHQAFKNLCFPVDLVAPPICWSCRDHQPGAACCGRTLTQLEALLQKSPDAYAALIVEPLVQGAGGMLMAPPGFLRAVRDVCRRYDVLLIADEVMTGFGRTGTMFACEQEDVCPDFMCLSKGLTAGYMPLGATLTTQRVYDAFYADPKELKTFFHGHTFTGHPLACAAALASLDLFEQNQLLSHVQAMAPIMAEELAQARGMPHVADVRTCGLIGAIELMADPAEKQPFPYHWRIGGELCTALRSKGVLLRPLADVVVIMPPLAINENDLRYLCRVAVESIVQIPHLIERKMQES
ncbi:MAG: adenosylmethionine--8-amino-7-oxononanoate transaminase [Phycisphaerae bacterium]